MNTVGTNDSALVICSDALREVFRTAKRVAQTRAAVLITGESGSGKELVARAIHQSSLRCSQPWVDVNCAALPEHLVESELFGYEKGAFSGAESAKQGLFELAHGGTLFLDEIGELEPKLQVKLLRVLDGAGYYRLGGFRKVNPDVRIVAATNLDFEQGVSSGKFRRDLYHRLNQIRINVPPLRERPEDILPLAEMFLNKENPSATLDSDAAEVLLAYSWPGNVRELQNAILKAVITTAGSRIRAVDLPSEIRRMPRDTQPITAGRLDEMEQQMILRALEETDGHLQKSARMLGISRRTLTRKLKSYGVNHGRAVMAAAGRA